METYVPDMLLRNHVARTDNQWVLLYHHNFLRNTSLENADATDSCLMTLA